MKLHDGAGVRCGGRNWTVVVDENEDGRSSWYECDGCGGTASGDDSMNDHDCQECAGCGEWFAELPVTADQSFFPDTRRYCHDDCLEAASERYWMGVWSA